MELRRREFYSLLSEESKPSISNNEYQARLQKLKEERQQALLRQQELEAQKNHFHIKK